MFILDLRNSGNYRIINSFMTAKHTSKAAMRYLCCKAYQWPPHAAHKQCMFLSAQVIMGEEDLVLDPQWFYF